MFLCAQRQPFDTAAAYLNLNNEKNKNFRRAWISQTKQNKTTVKKKKKKRNQIAGRLDLIFHFAATRYFISVFAELSRLDN